MAKITEDYCSKEIYRLLIEKGFDGEVHTTFDEEGYTQPSITHQMAIKWLREVHNIVIEIRVSHHFKIFDGYSAEFVKIEGDVSYGYCLLNDYRTYKEAVEAGIKYALENLI